MSEIDAALKAAGLGNDAYWKHKQSGKFIVYHWALEKAAAAKGVWFDPPTIVVADPANKTAVLLVQGHLGDDRTEWSFGEAAPYNTTQTYPFAMAEKRAKDRVILKLFGLHGEAYSEEEADDFKRNGKEITVADLRKAVSEFEQELREASDIDSLDLLVSGAHYILEQCQVRQPTWYHGDGADIPGLLKTIEARRAELRKKNNGVSKGTFDPHTPFGGKMKPADGPPPGHPANDPFDL